MENTGKLLFDHANLKYYLCHKGHITGPLTSQDIFEKIERGEVSLMDFVWRNGWSDFKRISNEKEFEVLIPNQPESYIAKELQRSIFEKEKTKSKKVDTTPPKFEDETAYYLYYLKTQYGPFNITELTQVLESGKIDDQAFVWIKGWKNWKKITELDEFASILKVMAKKSIEYTSDKIVKNKKTEERSEKRNEDRKDKRSSPRKPLVARLFVAHETDVIVAVCRDISMGGMQVLTDRVPGAVGSKIKLNISPADTKNFKSFIAEGEIVRHLEDGRGFSFRFTKLSADVKKTIQSYLG